MNIVHVIPSLARSSGGPAQAVAAFCRALPDEVKVTILTTTDDEGGWVDPGPGIQVERFHFTGRHSSKWSWGLIRALRKSLKTADSVHVHAAFSPLSDISAALAVAAGVRTVFRPLGTLSPWSLKYGNAAFKALYLLWLKPVLRRCVFHVTSQREAGDVQSLLPDADIRIVPVPYDLPATDSSKKRGHPLRVGFLSRLDPKKNVPALIQAAEPLLARGAMVLEIAGSGDAGLETFVQNAASKSDAIRYSGFLAGEAKEAFWQRTDLFVLPSLHENFGIAALEALAHGVPALLSSDVGLDADGTGGVFRCTTGVASIREGLEKACAMDEKAHELASRGAREAAQRFSNDAVRPDLIALYQ